MIQQIVNDINKALDAEAYLAALSLALTLPDICGRAQNPDLKTGERYKKWYNEHVGQYERSPLEPGEIETPYLSSEVVYQLRCCLLHEGNPNINKYEIKEESCQIDKFVIVVEKKNPFDIYADASSIHDVDVKKIKEYRVNVRRLCMLLTRTAENYYKEHKDQFAFFKYEILNWDVEMERLNRLRGE